MMNVSVIGSGKIVSEALPILCGTEGIHVRSLWTRAHSLDRTRGLASAHNVQIVCTDYDEVLTDPLTDCVYIALINSVHYEYALQALEAGKNVILEKPACLRAVELGHLVEVARRNHLFLFEAVTLLHLPAMHILRERLLPQIGRIRHVECNYSQRSSRMDRYLCGDVAPALDPNAGGGALTDINVYNLHFVNALLGKPLQASYHCLTGYNGVDLSGTALLRYPEALAVCTGSKETETASFGLIQGEKGWIRVNGPVSTMSGLTWCLNGGQPQEMDVPPVAHRLAPEFAAFASLYAQRDYDGMNHLLDHSLSVMELLSTLIPYGKFDD